jgi:hypothetical protein
MTKMYLSIVGIAAALAVAPVLAGEKSATSKAIAESTAKFVSDLTYTELLRQAQEKGWRYTPAQIENGYRRHFEEFKLQLIDRGYTILVGEAGA